MKCENIIICFRIRRHLYQRKIIFVMSRKRRIENSIFNLRKHIFKREIGCRTTRFTFQSDINLNKLENFSLSKHRDVKVVGHGAITSVAIDPLEWRYILAGNFVFSFRSIQKYTDRKVRVNFKNFLRFLKRNQLVSLALILLGEMNVKC